MNEQEYVLKNPECFSLKDIFTCGQCFRWQCNEENEYIGVVGENVIKIKKDGNDYVLKSKGKEDLKELTINYFDLERDYKKIQNTLSKIDENMEKSSDIIPVRIKRDESYYADVMAIDNKHFGELINYVSDMADKFKEEICEGNIDVNPIEKACTYCPYAGMCSFDVNAGDKYTEVPGYKLPEVISKLDEMYEDSEGEK